MVRLVLFAIVMSFLLVSPLLAAVERGQSLTDVAKSAEIIGIGRIAVNNEVRSNGMLCGNTYFIENAQSWKGQASEQFFYGYQDYPVKTEVLFMATRSQEDVKKKPRYYIDNEVCEIIIDFPELDFLSEIINLEVRSKGAELVSIRAVIIKRQNMSSRLSKGLVGWKNERGRAVICKGHKSCDEESEMMSKNVYNFPEYLISLDSIKSLMSTAR